MEQLFKQPDFYELPGSHRLDAEIIHAFIPNGLILTGQLRKCKYCYVPDTSDILFPGHMISKEIRAANSNQVNPAFSTDEHHFPD